MIKIAPSILSADFTRLEEEVRSIERAGADLIHVDVMDGHFVPNITVGVPIVASLKRKTKLPLDVHLMIDNPERFIIPFANAGADIITFHIEATSAPEEVLRKIGASGIRGGISLNPETTLTSVFPLLDSIDMVLIMSVNPGFAGQKFISNTIGRIKQLRQVLSEKKLNVDIEIDGGINQKNAKEVIAAGANILVAGTAIFGKAERKRAIELLRGG
ncbi:MAG: Ribulose-phosphate 3-epimerase [Syntrophomonadaceae bacterium]|nr:Ribulose-phosphate 3-epimerase [Bacillota bacterium]